MLLKLILLAECLRINRSTVPNRSSRSRSPTDSGLHRSRSPQNAPARDTAGLNTRSAQGHNQASLSSRMGYVAGSRSVLPHAVSHSTQSTGPHRDNRSRYATVSSVERSRSPRDERHRRSPTPFSRGTVERRNSSPDSRVVPDTSLRASPSSSTSRNRRNSRSPATTHGNEPISIDLRPFGHIPLRMEMPDGRTVFLVEIRNGLPFYVNSSWAWPVTIIVHRHDIARTSQLALSGVNFDQVRALGLRVNFAGEDGVDGGGLLTEWISEIGKKFAWHDFFVPNANNVLIINAKKNPTDYFYKFAGNLIGLSVMQGRPLGVSLTQSVYRFIMSEEVSFEDFESFDPVYYKSLVSLLDNETFDAVADDLRFTVEEHGGEVPLVQDGANRRVTRGNRMEYLKVLTKYLMVDSVNLALTKIKAGFNQVLPAGMSINSAQVAAKVLGNSRINAEDFLNHMKFATDVNKDWVVAIVKNFNNRNLQNLLKFITGTEILPASGFRSLGPRISVERHTFHTAQHLPTAATCAFKLYLPPYASQRIMEEKLLTAITSESDFRLS